MSERYDSEQAYLAYLRGLRPKHEARDCECLSIYMDLVECPAHGDFATASRRREFELEVEGLLEERQAVLDCINLYGDEVLHSALDGIGWMPRRRRAR